jgi:NADH-quinone oxidoreductase subunit J
MTGLEPTAAVLGIATLSGALGLWLMLPGGGTASRVVGALLATVTVVLIFSQLPGFLSTAEIDPGDPADIQATQLTELQRQNLVNNTVFFVLAGITVAAAAATVTFRSPVYCAIWFALSLLGTAGLFLFQGAQFLGVATIVVYAGAILVTFLFVLMLAQPRGFAMYDRLSWERLLSAVTGALMVGTLTLTVASAYRTPPRWKIPFNAGQGDVAQAGPLQGLKPPADGDLRPERILAAEHVAHLGAQLFSRHLISIEVAGTLLLVALVGSIAIAAQARPLTSPPGRRGPGADRDG